MADKSKFESIIQKAKNMALNDEDMAKAAGGNTDDAPAPKFSSGQRVMTIDPEMPGVFIIRHVNDYYSYIDGWLYTVGPEDGSYDDIPLFENYLQLI